jgi:hypothetical protein
MVPKGRDEDELDFGMAWVRYHDRYEMNGQGQEFADADMPYWPESVDKTTCGCASTSTSKSKEEALV